MVTHIDDIPVVTGPTIDQLTERQLEDYRDFKRDLIQWLRHFGKNPDKAEGYATETVRNVSYKIDQFYRWHWEEQGTYTTSITTEDADEYMKHLVYSDEEYSTTHKALAQKCFKRLFKYLNHQRGGSYELDPNFSFGQDLSAPRDCLTIEECKKIREAALPAFTSGRMS